MGTPLRRVLQWFKMKWADKQVRPNGRKTGKNGRWDVRPNGRCDKEGVYMVERKEGEHMGSPQRGKMGDVMFVPTGKKRTM